MKKYYVLLLFLTITTTACSGKYVSWFNDTSTDFVSMSYQIADQMDKQLAGNDAAKYPMLATTFVNAGNLEKSSDLGLLLSEQIASRLSQLGYPIVEMQLKSNQLTVHPQSGVLVLSRNPSEINTHVSTYSVLVGTYTTIDQQIYINTRVLRVQDGVALASADANLPFIRSKERDISRSSSSGDGVEVNAKTRL